MERHLKGVVACILGDLRSDKDDNRVVREQFTDENVRNWIKLRGGRIVEGVTEATTHLLCSVSAFNSQKKSHNVKSARKYGCYIVTYEWLADNIFLWDQLKRKAPPHLYHPGRPREDAAILALYRKREKKPKAAKKVLLSAQASTVKDDDVPEAAVETVDMKAKHLCVSEEKQTPNETEAGNEEYRKLARGQEAASVSANPETSEAIAKVQKCPKSRGGDPPIDLNLYKTFKDNAGALHRAEVSRPDKHGNPRGKRWILELYESKSTPKVYLFGARNFQTQSSRSCFNFFPHKVPGEKEYELEEFEKFFWKCTGVEWHKRMSKQGTRKYCYYGPAGSGGDSFARVGLVHHADQLERSEGQKPANTDDCDRGICDPKTSLKRKRSTLSPGETHPTRDSKAAKPSVVGDTATAFSCQSKAA